MGYQTEFNWVLKLRNSQLKRLEEVIQKERGCFEFEKSGYRTYPMELPIDLVNENWEAIARVEIFELNQKENKTEGGYEVLKVYTGEEKRVLTNYYQEVAKILKEKGAVS